MQKNPLGQETSAQARESSPFVGIPSTCQLVPSKRSRSGHSRQMPVAWQNPPPGSSPSRGRSRARGGSSGEDRPIPQPDAACGHHRGGPARAGGSDGHADPAAVRTGHATEPNALGAFGLRRGLLPPGVDTPEPALDEREPRQCREPVARQRLTDGRARSSQRTGDVGQGVASDPVGSGWTARASRCRPSARRACECSGRGLACPCHATDRGAGQTPEQETSSSEPRRASGLD